MQAYEEWKLKMKFVAKKIAAQRRAEREQKVRSENETNLGRRITWAHDYRFCNWPVKIQKAYPSEAQILQWATAAVQPESDNVENDGTYCG